MRDRLILYYLECVCKNVQGLKSPCTFVLVTQDLIGILDLLEAHFCFLLPVLILV